MSSRRLLALVIVGCGLLLSSMAVAQDETPVPGGKIVIAVANNPVGLDPQKSAAGSTLAVTQLIYSSLLTYDAQMNLIGDLAESYEVIDDVTYEFVLRDNAAWQDGTPVTAEDVKYSFDRIVDPETASPWLNIWQSALDEVTVIDDRTVRITTQAPFAPFLSYAASSWYAPIVNQGAVEEFGDLQQNAFGSGPFMLESYVPNSEVVLVRNPYYYEEGKPYLDSVEFRIIPNEASQLAALQAGTVNLMWSPDPFIEQRTRAIPNLKTFQVENMSATPAWWFNQTKAPFDDVNVRRAVSVGIDRNALIQTVLRGQGQMSTKIPPSSPYGYQGDGTDMPYYQYDPELARQLLADAGYANGFTTIVEIPAGYPVIQRATEVMQAQLAEVGIVLDIQVLEYGNALTRCINTEQDGMCAIRHVWQPDPDAYIYNIYQSGSSINLGKFNDETVDRLLEVGRETVNVPDRIAVYQELERHVADQALVIVPFAHDFLGLMNGDYVGYQPLPGGGTPGTRSLLPLVDTWLRQ